MTRRLLLLLALLALLLGAPGAARAGDDTQTDPDDNIVQAINTKNGSSLFKFSYSLRKVTGEVVDNANAAVAYSSCERCRTTAIAIQIVLVVGKPSTVAPENVAIAINENCTACQSFAYAFQFVVGVEDETVGLTKSGERELNKILREFRALKRENYTDAEFTARTKELGDRLRAVLATELKPRRGGDDDDDDEDDDDEQRTETERPAPPEEPVTTTSTADSTTTAETTTATGTTTDTATETTTETEPPATTETTTTTP